MSIDGNSRQRSSLLKKNILGSFLIKGWSAVVVFLMVPATLHCLGEYRNGIWLTISSLLLWIDNMDIGLGNGMRNKLTVYLAQGNIQGARSLISSTFAMLTLIIIPTLLILLGLIYACDTYRFLNVDPMQVSNLNEILMVTVTLVCTTFVFKLIGNFYMGLQLPAVNNLLIALGQTIALIGTWIIYFLDTHSLMQIALVNTGASLVVFLTAIPVTFCFKYPHLSPCFRLINLHEAKEVTSMGMQFFIMQIASLVLFATSYGDTLSDNLSLFQPVNGHLHRHLYAFLECHHRCLYTEGHGMDTPSQPEDEDNDIGYSFRHRMHGSHLRLCL